MYKYLIIEGLGWLFIIIVIVIVALKSGLVNKLLKFFKRKKVFKTIAVLGVLVLGVGMVLYGRTSYPVHFAMPATMHSVASDHNPPSLPLLSLWRFLTESRKFEFVKDVGADPNKVPSPINRTEPKTVELALTTKEVIAEV
ncbi:hypothetical protein KDA08_05145, partial [Candidatus Saccharibacteria bacterium]|nr:hypothetical protein [Candidatus Saccharibacteria bacterium]